MAKFFNWSGKKSTNAADFGSLLHEVAIEYVPVTPGATEFAKGATKGLLVTAAGTANLTQPDGTDRDGVPLVVGYNPISTIKVRVGGTATGIFAVY